MTSVPFVWSDAWILLSIIQGSSRWGGATVENIIKTGDSINHAIFNYQELDGGLARLMEAGHVLRTKDRFKISPTVKEEFKRLRGQSDGFVLLELSRWLGADPDSANTQAHVVGPEEVVTREEFDAAVQSLPGH